MTCLLSGLLLAVFVGFVQLKETDGTADLYEHSHYCQPPRVGETYMGAPAEAGNRLKLTINGKSSDEFDGFEPYTEYDLKISSSEWEQYVIYISPGTIITEGATCGGSTLLVADVMEEVEFRWKSGKDEQLPVVLTVGYAPYYTTVAVQQFTIAQLPYQEKTKAEL